MTKEDINALVGAFAPVIKAYFAKGVAPLIARLEALESHGIKYMGVWQRAVTFGRGNVTTDQGSAWIALRETQGERPGESDAWQLMVKRGADGKDAR